MIIETFNCNTMPDDILVRQMCDKDVDRVMKIWLETNIRAHHFIPESYWRTQYENVKAMISDAEVYVCEKSEHIIGFIGLYQTYIVGLFVASDFQSQGIGTLLLHHVKALKPVLQLNVYQKNSKAVEFYRKQGFVIETESVDDNTGELEFRMRMMSGCVDN